MKTISGSQEGLYLVLDAHSDLLGGMTVGSDFEGFLGYIDKKGSFSQAKSKGFQITPGHRNMVALSATRIDADEAIRVLDPKARNCRFPDENDDLVFHNSYSQLNCHLECALLDARRKLKAVTNVTCTPWNFPNIDGLVQAFAWLILC